ncbi:hypothetical protein C0Q70_05331 [Pomacea canaliculata]|uniref:Uncharacterized protein n=1 Tax=Pomacea canaliculata TaxID=400727 RepID=A0A2T7PKX0_POMCA|nr:hypothetical protein C0Q70_05331 [Pomacea canaliculata]
MIQRIREVRVKAARRARELLRSRGARFLGSEVGSCTASARSRLSDITSGDLVRIVDVVLEAHVARQTPFVGERPCRTMLDLCNKLPSLTPSPYTPLPASAPAWVW